MVLTRCWEVFGSSERVWNGFMRFERDYAGFNKILRRFEGLGGVRESLRGRFSIVLVVLRRVWEVFGRF